MVIISLKMMNNALEFELNYRNKVNYFIDGIYKDLIMLFTFKILLTLTALRRFLTWDWFCLAD